LEALRNNNGLFKGKKNETKLHKYPCTILSGPKTFEGEGFTILPDIQNNQTPLRHIAEELYPRYRSATLSSRILLLFIALEYCAS
jgi:hypothetical protein